MAERQTYDSNAVAGTGGHGRADKSTQYGKGGGRKEKPINRKAEKAAARKTRMSNS